ncbi:MAG: disulfide bond formation protein DsbD, partial [Pedobacter sp.]|nr:disulfide bond formation protein DsbD [Pedobacter sp.]
MKSLLKIFLLFFCLSTQAQISDPNAKIEKPVKWSYGSAIISDKEFDLIITARIEKGWHVYSQFIGDGGPIPTSFKFQPSPSY